jgi:hypothetical protein
MAARSRRSGAPSPLSPSGMRNLISRQFRSAPVSPTNDLEMSWPKSADSLEPFIMVPERSSSRANSRSTVHWPLQSSSRGGTRAASPDTMQIFAPLDAPLTLPEPIARSPLEAIGMSVNTEEDLARLREETISRRRARQERSNKKSKKSKRRGHKRRRQRQSSRRQPTERKRLCFPSTTDVVLRSKIKQAFWSGICFFFVLTLCKTPIRFIANIQILGYSFPDRLGARNIVSSLFLYFLSHQCIFSTAWYASSCMCAVRLYGRLCGQDHGPATLNSRSCRFRSAYGWQPTSCTPITSTMRIS